jgi:hypothetical protein
MLHDFVKRSKPNQPRKKERKKERTRKEEGTKYTTQKSKTSMSRCVNVSVLLLCILVLVNAAISATSVPLKSMHGNKRRSILRRAVEKSITPRISNVDALRHEFHPYTDERDLLSLAELQSFAMLREEWPEWADRAAAAASRHLKKAASAVNSAVKTGWDATKRTAVKVGGAIVDTAVKVKDTVVDVAGDVADAAGAALDWMKDKFDDIVEMGWKKFLELYGMSVRFIKFIANRLYAAIQTIKYGDDAVKRFQRERNNALKALLRNRNDEALRRKFTEAEGKYKTALQMNNLKKQAKAVLDRIVDAAGAISRALLPQLFVEGITGGVSALVGGVERVTDVSTGEIVYFRYLGTRIGTGIVQAGAGAYFGAGWKGTVLRDDLASAYSGWFTSADASGGPSIGIASLTLGGVFAVSAGMTVPAPIPIETFWDQVKQSMSVVGHNLKPDFSAVRTFSVIGSAGVGVNIPGVDIDVNVASTCYNHVQSFPNLCAKSEGEFLKKLVFDPLVLAPGGGLFWQMLKLGMYAVHRSENRFVAASKFRGFECMSKYAPTANCEAHLVTLGKKAWESVKKLGDIGAKSVDELTTKFKEAMRQISKRMQAKS